VKTWKPGERAYIMTSTGSTCDKSVTGHVLDTEPHGILIAFDHGGGAWFLATEVYDRDPHSQREEHSLTPTHA
jgi:hypothetical protein